MKYHTYPINISMPVETFHALTDACGEGYYGDVAETVVNDLILRPDPAMAGTAERLRTSFRGQQRFACVEGGAIINNGMATTPSRFANWDGCGSRRQK